MKIGTLNLRDNVGRLKPCPFCGGEAKVQKEVMGLYAFYKVKCTTCHAQSADMLPYAESAIEAWNRREGGQDA